jgi:hypothetical protein
MSKRRPTLPLTMTIDEEITPKMFQQLSIDSDDSSVSTTSPLPDAEDIEIGYNNYVLAKVLIPVNGYQFSNGVVKRRARDANGELIGKSNPNPLLDTSVYEVELENGSIERYHANILAKPVSTARATLYGSMSWSTWTTS